MQVKMVVEYPYDDKRQGFRAILNALRGKHRKLVLQIEDSVLDGDYFYFDELEISDIEYRKQQINEYRAKHYLMFTIGSEAQELSLIMFLYLVSLHGDNGHSYSIINCNNGEAIFWDGDGSDRIESINFDKDWKHNVYIDSNGKETHYANRDHLRWCTVSGMTAHKYEAIKQKKLEGCGSDMFCVLTDSDKKQIKRLAKHQMKRIVEKFNAIQDTYRGPIK